MSDWINISETIESAKLKRELDDAYYHNTWSWFKDAQKDKLWLYWEFKPEENLLQTEPSSNENLTEIQEQIESKKIDENPHSPLIETFVKQWLLSFEEWELVKKSLINNWSLEENINSINWLDKNKKQEIVKTFDFLNEEWTKEKCLEQFNKDFSQDIEKLKTEIEWWKKWEKDLQWRSKELIEQIWSNYFVFKWESWENKENIKDSLDRALKTTLNELIDNKTFNRDDSFEEKLKIVKNNQLSFEERFNKLKEIDTLINTDQSRANWKQANAFKNRKSVEKNKNQQLTQKFELLKQNIKLAENQNNSKELIKLKEELIILKEDAEKSWEVFLAWEIDTFNEQQEIQKET